jgi:hypothetical protein
MIHTPRGCPSADRLQKLLWRLSVSPYGTRRAASVLTAGGEALRDFSQEGQKIRRLMARRAHSTRNAAPDSLAAARPPNLSPSVLLTFL